jgi:hypothetical protein
MLINDTFEFEIPTHIKFTLYKSDYIDSIIISRVLKECKNWNNTEDKIYTVKAESFKNALLSSARLKTEIAKTQTHNLESNVNIKHNSITFLWFIFKKLPNLDWLSFNISYDKNFTRVVKFENKEILNFFFKIEEGIFNLTKVFDRKSLDIINRKKIEFGLMPNSYLDRLPYFYLKASVLFDILIELEADGSLNTFDLLDQIDHKLEEDDPLLLVITDYTSY